MEDNILDDDQMEKDNPFQNVRFAGFWIRVGATLVDMLVLLPLIGLSFYNIFSLKSLLVAQLIILINAAYKPLLEYQYGATVGKMAVKLKVVNEKKDLITANQAIIRYSPWLVSVLVNLIFTANLFNTPEFQDTTGFMEFSMLSQEVAGSTMNSLAGWLVIISAVALVFSPFKQALHDRLAKTYVIYKD